MTKKTINYPENTKKTIENNLRKKSTCEEPITMYQLADIFTG